MPAKKTPAPAPEPAAPTSVWIRNDSRQGALEVALLGGRRVGRGEVIEVTPSQAERLTMQAIWTVVDAPAPDTNNDGE